MFVQFGRFNAAAGTLPYEAVSNRFLEEPAHVGAVDEARLIALGFEAPLNLAVKGEVIGPNWFREVKVADGSPTELATHALTTLWEVYGVPPAAVTLTPVWEETGYRRRLSRSPLAPSATAESSPSISASRHPVPSAEARPVPVFGGAGATVVGFGVAGTVDVGTAVVAVAVGTAVVAVAVGLAAPVTTIFPTIASFAWTCSSVACELLAWMLQ